MRGATRHEDGEGAEYERADFHGEVINSVGIRSGPQEVCRASVVGTASLAFHSARDVRERDCSPKPAVVCVRRIVA